MPKKIQSITIVLILSLFILSGCYKPGPGAKLWQVSGYENTIEINEQVLPTVNHTVTVQEFILSELTQSTPTPNAPIILPTLRSESLRYTVRSGDTLKKLAQQYQVTVDQLVVANDIENPNLISVGQVIVIPPPSFENATSAFKIIPDSELISSPSNAAFNVSQFIASQGGYLATYTEVVDEVNYSGPEIVARVALEYSVNPRLLLALLEYQSGWVSNNSPSEETLAYPMGFYAPLYSGLYKQLGWASNLLNEGYYLWKIDAISVWTLSDGNLVGVEPTINPGTAGVINLLSHLYSKSDWEVALSENGLFRTYGQFFGYPFDYSFESIIPDNLVQPNLQLPFEEGDEWSFTGGPHGGWNTGSGWAAIDFAPPGEALGCFPSSAWVVASAPGEIVYSDHGAVIQDLDGDGIWQTGWSILYMHIASWERIEVGTTLVSGDRIGHPSCEGGFSTGTHLHIARRYNGEWVAADAEIPLVLDGWVSVGYGVEYDGYLVKGDMTLEAWNGRSPLNAIKR